MPTEPGKIQNFIDGNFVEPVGGKYLDNIEPATGKSYSQVADSDSRDVDLAVAAAEKAFADWSKKGAAERSQILLRIADLIERDLEKFARAESIDTGKPLSLARSLDIPRAVSNFRFFATAILHTENEAHVTDGVAFNYTLRQPRGIAGLISPWNLPLYLLSWKIAPAIAVGNTAIAKPSELTPMTAFLLCEVCAEAGLPNGVLNIVHGTGPNVGAPITAHPKIGTISFTGGTVTGKKVAEAGAPLFKKISLELGGKNPNIIFADADLDAAIAGSVRSSFANQGQVCLCGSRVFVERSVYKNFVDRFIDKASQLKVGDPLDEKTEQGAIVSKTQLDKVKFYVDLAQKEGGKIALGGKSPESVNDRCRDGYFFPPTVITGLPVVVPYQSRRNLWPGHHHHAVRQRRRSNRLRQRHRLRPGLERLDAKPESRPSRRGTHSHRHGLGKLLARARLARPLRRHESQRRRPRRRRRSAALLHRAKNICIAK